MSHYFYNNVFDYVSADGNFGYFIEKDYLNSSSNSAVPSESNGGPDYIVEVHYLGGTAGTLKINVNDIDATKVEHVDWAPKGIGAPYVASPEGTFIWTLLMTQLVCHRGVHSNPLLILGWE